MMMALPLLNRGKKTVFFVLTSKFFNSFILCLNAIESSNGISLMIVGVLFAVQNSNAPNLHLPNLQRCVV